MSTTTTFRFSLYKGSKKIRCVGCGHNTSVPYIDNETGEWLPERVSRCDRENNCGYHYTPKQYYSEEGQSGEKKPFIDIKTIQEPEVQFLPIEYLTRSVGSQFYGRNNFFQFSKTLFGEKIASELFLKYLIGTSSYWKGAVLFPQIDELGRLRQIKIMLHDKYTGKRVKEGATVEKWDRVIKQYVSEISDKSCSLVYGKYLDDYTRKLNLEQCWFGQHLLTEYPDKNVCIVESEKTAVIASVYIPQFIWLATGGASGCKWRDYNVYQVLKNRNVTLFPDYGFFNKKTGKTCYQEWCERADRIREVLPCKIRVSDVLENRLAGQERNDEDLADLLLIRDKKTGIALTENEYPVIWDFQ